MCSKSAHRRVASRLGENMKMKILVGLPASGKSTIAHGLVITEDAVRINYDDLRWYDSFGEPKEYHFTRANEEKIKELALSMATIAADRGKNLVIDNTNLTQSAKDFWVRFAA